MAGTSEGNKKGAITRKKIHGKNTFKEAGAKGGRNKKTGYYFKTLKEQGRLDELKAISAKGASSQRTARIDSQSGV